MSFHSKQSEKKNQRQKWQRIVRYLRIVRLIPLFAVFWFVRHTRTQYRKKASEIKEKKRKKIWWRLFKWSRFLNAAAAHHAHCRLVFSVYFTVQYSLKNLDNIESRNQKPQQVIAIGMIVFGMHVVVDGFFNHRVWGLGVVNYRA